MSMSDHEQRRVDALMQDLPGLLAFLRAAESLKHTTRTSWTSAGVHETVAAHTWRLCLMALVLAPYLPDLGEAISGDISAVLQVGAPSKAEQERADLEQLTAPLPESLRAEFLALWDEYEQAATPEARMAKGLDKLETILQHNQGAMPPGFDFRFNLQYGAQYTQHDPVLQALRAVLDAETEARAVASDDVSGGTT